MIVGGLCTAGWELPEGRGHAVIRRRGRVSPTTVWCLSLCLAQCTPPRTRSYHCLDDHDHTAGSSHPVASQLLSHQQFVFTHPARCVALSLPLHILLLLLCPLARSVTLLPPPRSMSPGSGNCCRSRVKLSFQLSFQLSWCLHGSAPHYFHPRSTCACVSISTQSVCVYFHPTHCVRLYPPSRPLFVCVLSLDLE